MTDYRVAKGEAQEDQITASIEKFTAQIPSSVYLALALGSMATSLAFQAAKKQHEALFIGQWAAPFLILVMLISSDREAMHDYTNGRLARLLGWTTTILMTAAALAYLALNYG